MTYSRRDLSLLIPALLGAAQADGQTDKQNNVLPSKCYTFDSLPVKANPQTHSVSRQVFDGYTHSGVHIDMHITTLPPGGSPHPPHQHVHEEMMMIQEGTVELTISGQASRIGPGGVAYVHSNDLHGLKNVGDGPAQYFVLAIGQHQA